MADERAGGGVTRPSPPRALLDAVLAVSHHPVVLLDADGRIVRVGAAAERELGWDPDRVRGARLADLLVAAEDRGRLPTGLLAAAARPRGMESRTGVPCRRLDGSEFPAEVSVVEVGGDGTDGMLVTVDPEPGAAAEGLFQRVFAHAPDIISVIDRRRGQILVNRAAERILGHNIRRLEANREMVHPDDLERVSRELDPPPRGFGGPVRYRARTAWGDWRWLESTSADLENLPAVGGMLVFSRDVTAEVEAGGRVADANARLVSLVAGLRAGVLLEDEDGIVVTANEVLFAMFGLRGGDRARVGDPAQPAMAAIAGRMVDGERFLTDRRLVRDERRGGVVDEWTLLDGRTVERECAAVHREGRFLGHMWAFRDVSARVTAEEQRLRTIRLESEARRAAEEQNRRLADLERMRSQLIATVSHELRTPLTPIASHLELLLDGYPTELPAEHRRMVEVIARNAERLRRLVDDLLTMRRVEQGLLEIRREPVDVPEVVGAGVEQYRPVADRLGIGLDLEATGGPPVVGDADRLAAVVDNLLGNALKFTGGGGSVAVTAVHADREWRIEVTDTGCGIAPEELPHVFEPFFRTAEVMHEGLPGTGLGLAVSRALVEGMGGHIGVRSAPGAGSSFLVRLPAAGGERPE